MTHFLFHPSPPKFQPLPGWAAEAMKVPSSPTLIFSWEMQPAIGVPPIAASRTAMLFPHDLKILSMSLLSGDKKRVCPSMAQKLWLMPALHLCLTCTGCPCLGIVLWWVTSEVSWWRAQLHNQGSYAEGNENIRTWACSLEQTGSSEPNREITQAPWWTSTHSGAQIIFVRRLPSLSKHVLQSYPNALF